MNVTDVSEELIHEMRSWLDDVGDGSPDSDQAIIDAIAEEYPGGVPAFLSHH